MIDSANFLRIGTFQAQWSFVVLLFRWNLLGAFLHPFLYKSQGSNHQRYLSGFIPLIFKVFRSLYLDGFSVTFTEVFLSFRTVIWYYYYYYYYYDYNYYYDYHHFLQVLHVKWFKRPCNISERSFSKLLRCLTFNYSNFESWALLCLMQCNSVLEHLW